MNRNLTYTSLEATVESKWTAEWIGYDAKREDQDPPPVYLRSDFEISKDIDSATLQYTALGIADMWLNGTRVSNDYFNPGWTEYDSRIYYRSYDVTDLLLSGKNAIGGILADGWYAGFIGWDAERCHYGNKPRLSATLRINYSDGSHDHIHTDKHWKSSFGAWKYADFLSGEYYDARKELSGWCNPDYNDSLWHSVHDGSGSYAIIQADPSPPVKVIEEIPAKSIKNPIPCLHIVDFGQNFSGMVRLKIKGERGTIIRIRHAEILDSHGALYTTNLRSADATDYYVCKGEGEEVWEPRFTFHGFRYIEIRGLKDPTLDTFTGIAISSDTPRVGHFDSSSTSLNQLVSNIYWTQRANFISIPTDCPQRDERLGWTGDAQVYARTASYLCDVHSFFKKWLTDLQDSALSDGSIPPVSPQVVTPKDMRAGAGWEDAAVICPWTIYQVYGDIDVLQQSWPMITKFLDYKRTTFSKAYKPLPDVHCFGDWLNLDDDTPHEIIRLAYMAYSSKIGTSIAQILGKDQEAERFTGYYEESRSAFNKTCVDTDGRIMFDNKGGSQTAYALALEFGILDETQTRAASEHLIRNIEKRDHHLSTGFIGTCKLLNALTLIGRNDIAYRLLLQESYPSWLFPVKNGATSIWEHWDGWTLKKGFQDPHMNSYSHYAYGAVYEWMVENIGGIQILEPGCKKILIKPQLPPHDSPEADKLKHANITWDSPMGLISSSWKRNGATFYEFEIPKNVTAQISLAEESKKEIKGDKLPDIKSNNGRIEFGLPSGSYVFELR